MTDASASHLKIAARFDKDCTPYTHTHLSVKLPINFSYHAQDTRQRKEITNEEEIATETVQCNIIVWHFKFIRNTKKKVQSARGGKNRERGKVNVNAHCNL
jgi:hypothetical protein